MNDKIPLRYEFEYGVKTCILDKRLDFYDYINSDELVKNYNFSWDLAFFCRTLGDMYNETINWSSPHDGLTLDPEFIKFL